ncbi:hypothetical protein B0T16DRAFT_171440 [Cercophora newfieldiana]|uniref:AAA+ ATPase domain-containing protein n=1 Tax=Cercophora newfieldiana TaxID=92897 RepID=A0AA39Y6K4_9PEZI|nr:hypothetical protein B0T16DRAFT_171440 [Cercophora newfieldiana]
MGSLAILTMANKPVHPFFTPGRVAAPIADECESIDTHKPADPIATVNDTVGEKSADDATEKTGKSRNKRRKVADDQDEIDEPKKPRSKKRAKASIGGGIANHFKKLPAETPDPTASNESSHDTASTSAFAGPTQSIPETPDQHTEGAETSTTHPEDRTLPSTRPQNSENPQSVTQVLSSTSGGNITKPKKLLQLNAKTGTIGSPPRQNKTQPVAGKTAKGSKEARQSTKENSRIVALRYGTDDQSRVSLGNRIDAILSTPKRPSTPTSNPSPKSTMKKSVTPKDTKKMTHPFFLGKAKKAQAALTSEETKTKQPERSPAKVRMKEFSSTPCSPKKPRVDLANMRMPQFGVKNSGLKFPGAKLPAWPAKDMAHVRGQDHNNTDACEISLPLPPRKSKGNSVKIPSSESVIEFISCELGVPEIAEAVRNVNNDVFLPAPAELRLPEKHFESGRKLQGRIVSELKTFKTPPPLKKTMKAKQATNDNDKTLCPPPQLAHLFDSVSSSLSAFDKSQCETVAWTQKYAPTSAIEVLQPGREPFLLRDWLQALMVQSVDTGATEGDKSKSKGKAGAGKKKRRKKLDGFVVSSDDEDYELYALSDDDADWTPSGSRGIVKKTVVRQCDLSKGKDGDKIANTLVISGPAGCGKTALVYAVAKELGFEIFEINSCSRRSGKDVLEKIGDMTRNHLVQQQSSASPAEEAVDDETAKDIKSGKQPTMNAFFKLQAGAVKPKKPVEPSSPEKPKDSKKEPKTQRQSLILLEEADILYEEDKQFWATVTSLIVQSKRPFIVTCNDETLLPLMTLKLHGIFRLSTPPRDLAIDRLLLIAANEGHALKRDAVESLYDSRCEDLRAATTDLQYWCQIGVGDRRGGFDWFYPRWPKGIDLDEEKQVVRVVSEGTYSKGMNWLGRDSIVDPKVSARLTEEELLLQSWEFWALDIGQWEDSLGLGPWAEEMKGVTTTPQSRLEALDAFDQLADSLSIADMCACGSFGRFQEELLDATLPDPSAKTRDDCILGLTPLDTPSVTHHHSSPAAMMTTIKSLAKSVLRAKTEKINTHCASEIRPSTESAVIDCIQNSFKTPVAGTNAISRIDFAFAFDPLAASDLPTQAVSYLDPSVLDRTLKMITLDVAPFLRGIVAYDLSLQKQRRQLSSLVSEGGKAAQGSKRMRTTRAALSALEGGSRSTTRGERWFKAEINPYLVMKTGGKAWANLWPEETDAPFRAPVSPSSKLSTAFGPSSASSESPSPSASSPPAQPAKQARKRGRPRKVVQDDSGDEFGEDGPGS